MSDRVNRRTDDDKTLCWRLRKSEQPMITEVPTCDLKPANGRKLELGQRVGNGGQGTGLPA